MNTIDPLNPSSSQDNATSGLSGSSSTPQDNNAAADLIRHKLESLFEGEPDAKIEAAESEAVRHRSKHQKFMHELTTSGKSLVEIQTAWHNYYIALPDDEKHKVWQEFYAAQGSATAFSRQDTAARQTQTQQARPVRQAAAHPEIGHAVVGDLEPEKPVHHTPRKRRIPTKSVRELKNELLSKVDNRSRAKLKAKHHLQSLAFGVGMGAIVVLILLFGFFNERFIAPFITPSRNVSATPIIINPDSVATGTDPKVIIPKINVEIPVVYDEPSITEAAVDKALERGVIHYATTPNPGEKGNAVVFGHSSNNILNPGKYKFAFVLLSRLDTDDVFYLQKDGKRYAYKVFEKKIVDPSDVSVLDPINGKVATATLITCDPPGTSLRRLVVIGEQISPDPNGDVASTALSATAQPKVLPSNAPSLWSRLFSWL